MPEKTNGTLRLFINNIIVESNRIGDAIVLKLQHKYIHMRRKQNEQYSNSNNDKVK